MRVGLHAASIGQYERGVQFPRRETAQALDDALEADGALLVAFGYAGTDGLSQLDALAVRQAKLEQAVRRLAAMAMIELPELGVPDAPKRDDPTPHRAHRPTR